MTSLGSNPRLFILASHWQSPFPTMRLRNVIAARRNLKEWFLEILKEKKAPFEIALGFAIGIMIGVLPSPGLNIAIALGAVALFKINKVATLAAIALTSNPLATPLIFLSSFKIGVWITRATNINIKAISIETWTSYFKILVIGNAVLTVAAGIISFTLVYFIFRRIEFKRLQKELIMEALEDTEEMELEEAMKRN